MIQDHRIGSVRPERIDIDVGFDPGQFYHPEKTIRLCHTCASQERKISVDLDTHFGTRLAFCDIVGIVGITEAGKSGCYPITIGDSVLDIFIYKLVAVIRSEEHTSELQARG